MASNIFIFKIMLQLYCKALHCSQIQRPVLTAAAWAVPSPTASLLTDPMAVRPAQSPITSLLAALTATYLLLCIHIVISIFYHTLAH